MLNAQSYGILSSLLFLWLAASPIKLSDKRSEKKLKILFIGDAAETVATLPINVGDEVSFRNACFVSDFFFEKMGSFYEMMLCIGSPPSFNRLKNMFYRKKDSVCKNMFILVPPYVFKKLWFLFSEFLKYFIFTHNRRSGFRWLG